MVRHAIAVLGIALVITIGFTLFRSPRPLEAQRAARLPEVLRTELHLRDGCLYRNQETNTFTGWMVERYDGGALKSRSAISNGLLSGLSEGWYTNGHRQITEHFKEGVSHGLRVKWYPDGTKLSEAMILDGRLQGLFRRWHENGALAEEVRMNDGQPDGIATAYFPNGWLKSQTTLEGGKIIAQKSW